MATRHAITSHVLYLLVACLALPAGGGRAQEPTRTDTLPPTAAPRPVPAAILGGSLGSAVGLAGGAGIGHLLAPCASDQTECDGGAELGAFMGSVLGAALGAKLLAERNGASPSLTSALLAATGGIFTGGLFALMVRSIGRNPVAGVVSFSVGQGVFTGLVAARRR